MLCYWEYASGEFEDIPEDGIQVASQTSTGILMMKKNQDDGIWERAITILGAEPYTRERPASCATFWLWMMGHRSASSIWEPIPPRDPLSCPQSFPVHPGTPVPPWARHCCPVEPCTTSEPDCKRALRCLRCRYVHFSHPCGGKQPHGLDDLDQQNRFRSTELISQWKQAKMLWVKWGIITLHIQTAPGHGDQWNRSAALRAIKKKLNLCLLYPPDGHLAACQTTRDANYQQHKSHCSCQVGFLENLALRDVRLNIMNRWCFCLRRRHVLDQSVTA